MTEPVRTRFAPSPTGFMHIGNFRTGLFAWLVARHAGGTFVLRLEDTDKKREVEGSAEHILRCFKELGLDVDEGIEAGGVYGPYKQSERLDTYKQWAQKLVDAGRAYADPYMPEEVQAFREEAQKTKKPFLYRNHRPESPPEWDGTQPLRLKSDPRAYEWHDEVMGDLSTGPEVVDDFILMKSDGYPTYNFAHIVDDAEMQISHIIRGQEFISSTPNYLNLYEALEVTPPTFATMPHILNEQGNKKLGKRDGAQDVLDYIKEGYLPDALISFIATLGWNDGTEQEVFTRDELIEKFSLDRVGKSGAQFDMRRLNWVNGHFIRSLSVDSLHGLSKAYLPAEAAESEESYNKQVIGLIQERLKYLGEIPELTQFFYTDLPINIDLITGNKQLKKRELSELRALLEKSQAVLELSDFSTEDIQKRLNDLLVETDEKPAVLFSIIRIATTWSPASPALADTLAVLGKDRVLSRLQQSINALK
ncbi:glutamate--tRNA ligase [Candidatus Saccharibacteria bacterium]|nr:glutamate--tRNA ligase [Candidatus Saccharibacteria bacterium]